MSQNGAPSFASPSGSTPPAHLEALFTRLYEYYEEPVRRHLQTMVRDAQLAADLTQDAFARAWLALPRFRPESERAWVYRIATNVALDHLRRDRVVRLDRWERYTAAFHPGQVAPDDPERDALVAEAAQQVRAVWARLDPRFAQALALRHLLDLPYAECARRLGVTLSSFKSLLFRARDRFARLWPQVTDERPPPGAVERASLVRPAPPPRPRQPRQPRGSGLRYRPTKSAANPWSAEPYDPARLRQCYLGTYPTREAAAAAIAAWRAAGGVCTPTPGAAEGVPA
jgi:RNA polymerase sigma-70 factor, ECF subfamily